MLQKIQILLAKNKPLIVTLFTIFHFVLVGIFLVGPVIFLYGSDDFKSISIDLGRTFGQVAFIFYTVTLIPGILGRFKIFDTVKAILTLFRRQIGVSTFLMAVIHEGYLFTIPVLISTGLENFFKLLTSHEIYGFIALLILFPMWLTSNNFSERNLGKYWKLLHRITYIALLIIFLHIVTTGSTLLIVIALIMILLEIVSWIVFIIRSRRQTSEVIVPPAPPSINQTPDQNVPIVTGTSTTL